MTIDDWFTWATADAERRGLSSLTRMLDSLRTAVSELREADWNADATGLQSVGERVHRRDGNDERSGHEEPERTAS